MGRQVDEFSVFFFWRPANYVTSLCYCFISLANKLMMMMTMMMMMLLCSFYEKMQEGQHPLTGQRAPPISGGT